jgi:hypothetical protein
MSDGSDTSSADFTFGIDPLPRTLSEKWKIFGLPQSWRDSEPLDAWSGTRELCWRTASGRLE